MQQIAIAPTEEYHKTVKHASKVTAKKHISTLSSSLFTLKLALRSFTGKLSAWIFHQSTECKMQSCYHFCVASVLLSHVEISTYFEFSVKILLNFKLKAYGRMKPINKTVLAECLWGGNHQFTLRNMLLDLIRDVWSYRKAKGMQNFQACTSHLAQSLLI